MGKGDEVIENVRVILVPVDFSKCSRRAFRFARELMKCLECELHIVHVLDTDFLSGAFRIIIEPLDDSVTKLKKRAERKLKTTYRDENGRELKGRTHIREGRPYEEILRVADELKADMIVIGSNGRMGLERAIFGSVAARVSRMAKVPVLIYK